MKKQLGSKILEGGERNINTKSQEARTREEERNER